MATLAIVAGLLIVIYVVVEEVAYRTRGRRRRVQTELHPILRQDWRTYVPFLLGIALALLFRSPLISVYVLVIGALATLYFFNRSKVNERAQMDRQVSQLILAFRSIYKIRPAVFSALEEAHKKVDEPLAGHVALAVQTFYVTAAPDRAYAELRGRVDNPYLNQFLYILERSETARREAVMESLDRLMERCQRHAQLRDKSEVELTAITGQTRFIQIISLIIIFFIAATSLREAYTESLGAQVLFVGLATVAVATSWYIDRRTVALKERIL